MAGPKRMQNEQIVKEMSNLRMKHEARRTTSSTNTQTLNSLPPSLPRTKNGVWCGGLEWNQSFLFFLFFALGGLRAQSATAPHKEEDKKKEKGSWWNESQRSPNKPTNQLILKSEWTKRMSGIKIDWVGGYGAEPICATTLHSRKEIPFLPLRCCCLHLSFN